MPLFPSEMMKGCRDVTLKRAEQVLKALPNFDASLLATGQKAGPYDQAGGPTNLEACR